MPPLTITASDVVAGVDDNGVPIVAFSGSVDGDDFYLLVMGGTGVVDPQDVELGHDTFYIELNDQSRGGYGGVSGIDVSPHTVTFSLTETGRRQLGLQQDMVVIKTALGADQWSELVARIAEIFDRDPSSLNS